MKGLCQNCGEPVLNFRDHWKPDRSGYACEHVPHAIPKCVDSGVEDNPGLGGSEGTGIRPVDATRNRGVEAHGIIHQAIKASTNRARRDGRNATYYEKAKAVVLALREAGFDV